MIVTGIADYLGFPFRTLAPLKLRREAKAEGLPWPPVPRGAAVLRWRELMARHLPAVPVAEVDPARDPAILSYTGGTTGVSKGAALTHANLVANVWQVRAWTQGTDIHPEGVVCALPLFHLYGLLAANFGLGIGGELVLVPRFDLRLVFEAIVKARPTWFPGVPRMYIAINEDPTASRHDLSSIRTCFSAAAPLPQSVAQKFEALTGGDLVEGYGLTEASPTVLRKPHPRHAQAGHRRDAAAGHDLPGHRPGRLDHGDAPRCPGGAHRVGPPGHAGVLEPSGRDRPGDPDGRGRNAVAPHRATWRPWTRTATSRSWTGRRT